MTLDAWLASIAIGMPDCAALARCPPRSRHRMNQAGAAALARR